MSLTNETHDPALTSWVESANSPAGDFPIQNLPFGIFRRRGSNESFRGGVAIGEQIVDFALATSAGVFAGDAAKASAMCAQPTLNALMAMGAEANSALRRALSQALRRGSAEEGRLFAG